MLNHCGPILFAARDLFAPFWHIKNARSFVFGVYVHRAALCQPFHTFIFGRFWTLMTVFNHRIHISVCCSLWKSHNSHRLQLGNKSVFSNSPNSIYSLISVTKKRSARAKYDCLTHCFASEINILLIKSGTQQFRHRHKHTDANAICKNWRLFNFTFRFFPSLVSRRRILFSRYEFVVGRGNSSRSAYLWHFRHWIPFAPPERYSECRRCRRHMHN